MARISSARAGRRARQGCFDLPVPFLPQVFRVSKLAPDRANLKNEWWSTLLCRSPLSSHRRLSSPFHQPHSSSRVIPASFDSGQRQSHHVRVPLDALLGYRLTCVCVCMGKWVLAQREKNEKSERARERARARERESSHTRRTQKRFKRPEQIAVQVFTNVMSRSTHTASWACRLTVSPDSQKPITSRHVCIFACAVCQYIASEAECDAGACSLLEVSLNL